jgi:hypothetical protein
MGWTRLKRSCRCSTDAWRRSGTAPSESQRGSIVERDASRVLRLRRALKDAASHHIGDLPVKATERGWLVQLEGAGLVGASPYELSRLPGAVADKPHIFVAMPFAEAFNDLFEYGIQRPVRTAAFSASVSMNRCSPATFLSASSPR